MKVLSTGPLESRLQVLPGLRERRGVLYIDFNFYMENSHIVGEVFHKLNIVPIQVSTNLAVEKVFVYFVSPLLDKTPLGYRPPMFEVEIETDDGTYIKNVKLVEREVDRYEM